jgi:fructose-1,6-bisphosphatase I
MYPSTSTLPNGKLRLLYECNPMAFIVEQAGGKATNGKDGILQLNPVDLHQRTPMFIGSTDMVNTVGEFIDKFLKRDTT